MTTPLTPRRRARERGASAAEPPGPTPAEEDALADLRAALTALDPSRFAACFAPGGWLRVPRPEGDVVLTGPAEIERAGRELYASVAALTWTPSQRFVAAGQVVEEAVAMARLLPRPGTVEIGRAPDPEWVRVPMRAVAAIAPAGGVGSLTLWIDWAALRDPLGVRSARGAASALVAQARARDDRGLQVIRSEPGAAPMPPTPRDPVEPPVRPPVPAAPVLWWQSHRATLAGTAMAVAAALVVGWVALTVLRETGDPAGGRPPVAGSTLPASSPSLAAPTATSAGPDPEQEPVIRDDEPNAEPTVQPGRFINLKSDLLFRTDSADLTSSAMSVIGQVADDVRRAGVSGNIQINGYTDDRGTENYNAKLSRQRAREVARVLQKQLKGLPVTLTPQGFGESMPVETNRTAAGRAVNRHVTVVLPPPDSAR